MGTVDLEVANVKSMIIKAFDNDLVGGHASKSFKRVMNAKFLMEKLNKVDCKIFSYFNSKNTN